MENIDPAENETEFFESTLEDSLIPTSSEENIFPLQRSNGPLTLSMLTEASTSSSSLGPVRCNRKQASTRNGTLEFMEYRHKHETEIQKQRLQLDEEKLRLEKEQLQFQQQKFQLEREERIIRLNLEEQERKNNIASCNNQRQLMEILLQLLNKQNTST